jgi:hypothetical protein
MFFHYLAIDASGNKIGRVNLTQAQVEVHTSNLVVSGYVLHTVSTPAPIEETDEALLATVDHPMF